jgi:hypothetical protein
VGPTGTYASIQSGLFGCAGGSGDVILSIQNGTYVELGLFYPFGLTSVHLRAADFATVPNTPIAQNVTAHIYTYGMRVAHPYTALYYEGVQIDGLQQSQPMFATPLINNNITFTRSLVSNFTGEFAVRGQACDEAVTVESFQTRWYNVWGTSVDYMGLDSFDFEGNVFEVIIYCMRFSALVSVVGSVAMGSGLN